MTRRAFTLVEMVVAIGIIVLLAALTITASVTSKTSVNRVLAATADPDIPDALSLEGGNNQIGLVSAPLTDPVEAKVEDQFGNGVPGETVDFAVTGGGGSITMSVVTDANEPGFFYKLFQLISPF